MQKFIVDITFLNTPQLRHYRMDSVFCIQLLRRL